MDSSRHHGRVLSDFTVELDVYSGPYEGLLALILRDELEIFEVPLRELIGLYRSAHPEPSVTGDPGVLERDTEFADSATSLILLKSRALAPAIEPFADDAYEPISTDELSERLTTYLKVRRAAENLRDRLELNADIYPTAHFLKPRPGKLRIRGERLTLATKRLFSRTREPAVDHLGPITVTIQELAVIIRSAIACGPVSFEELTENMDRLRTSVAFAATLSLASEGNIILSQEKSFGPLTLKPGRNAP